MKNGRSPSAIVYRLPFSRSTYVSSRLTAARRFRAARTVSTSRWPPESSSSSRSPSARSPSGPGLSALMNIEVIEHGPEISMPGFLSSSGAGGTFQSPVVASLGGSGAGRRPACASASSRARSARSFSARAFRRSWSAARNSLKAGVNRRSAPSTGSNRTRDVGVIGWRSPAPERSADWGRFRMAAPCCQWRWGAPKWPPNPPSLRSVPAEPCRSSRPRQPCGPRNRPSNGGGVLSMAEWRSAMASPRRFRGVGKGRKTRRALERGGIGPAARLNRALGAWAGVRITPMFGRWGYFAGARLFACFPLARKETDLWIRLSPTDQSRALREPGVRPHRRFARRGWIELDLVDDADVPRALRWLRRAHTADLPAEEAD